MRSTLSNKMTWSITDQCDEKADKGHVNDSGLEQRRGARFRVGQEPTG